MRFMTLRSQIFHGLITHLPTPVKVWYLRKVYKWRIGRNNRFWNGVRLDGDTYGKVTIGDNCEFPRGTSFNTNGNATIVIGSNVVFGHDVTLLGADHDPHARDFAMRVGNIVISDGCWIASKVSVLKDVEIGRETVVGYGSVVTRSLPPNVIAAGLPAKVIKPRFDVPS